MASEDVQEEVKGVVEENHVVTENGVPEEKTVTDVQDKGIVEAEGEDEEVKQVTADVSNGGGADVSADVTKEVDASMPEPDSWEDVEALEERLKTLSTVDEIAAEKERKDEKTIQGGGASGSGGGRLSPQRIVVDGRQGAMPDQVDQVLRMGLTNPRDPGDRLAILRMDQEVERFMRTPNLQQLELGPLPSSYMRMAAHKVAQHYLLSTSSQIDTGLDGQPVHKVVAVKTPECRLPSFRLCDIPMAQRSPRSQGPVKLAIKPRNTGHHSNGESRQRQTGPLKSVEERNEEYQKARARIFNQEKEAAAQNGGVMRGPMGSPRGGLVGFGPEMGPRNMPLVQNPMDGGYGGENSAGRGGGSRGNGEGGNGKRGKGPAIFRDREKEKRDPDFDRSSRFNGRYDPSFGAPMMPYMPMFVPPQAMYTAEFPPLGAQQGMQGGGMGMGEMSPQGGQMPVSWMPAMVGGPGAGQPFNAPNSPIQFAPGVQHFSPPAGQFVGPLSPQFSPQGQPYMGMAPFPQQGAFASPNGQQFMTPQFAQQFPQNQGMPFRGVGMQFGVPANGQQFNQAGGQFRPPPGGGVQFQVQQGQPQQGSPGMNAPFQGGNGQGFAPNGVPMFGSQPMGGFAMPGGVMYVSPDQFQAQPMDQFRPPHPAPQQLSPPPQQSQPPPRRR